MKKRILIVDDATIMRYAMRALLEKSGFEVVAEAATGKAAIELYALYKPDLVTMDITMPEMDGIPALQEILRIDPKAKVIICSALGQRERVKEAILAGAKGFLVKPWKPEKFVSTLRSFLKD